MLDLAEVLDRRVRERGSDVAFRLFRSHRSEFTDVTYAQLGERAAWTAAVLRERGMANRRVLLVYHDPIEYLFSLFGCWLAKAVPVTVKPFLHYRPGPSAAHLRAVVMDADPGAIFCSAETAAALRKNADLAPALESVLVLDSVHEPPRPELTASDASANASAEASAEGSSAAEVPLAHIQYTSGSTGAPRGVMVSMANLMAGLEDLAEAFGLSDDSLLVSWLPHYHDMGLIGCLLLPVVRGFQCVVTQPIEFLQQPMRWLELIAMTGATHSVGPNFAYELCATAAAKRAPADLDLGRWKVAIVAAEPIHPETLDRFAEAFAYAGFSSRAFLAGYGLAEATLKVSTSKVGHTPTVITLPNGRRVVGCGPATRNEVQIVDPEAGTPRPDGEEGEIWVRGPSVALGYWNRPEETERVFGAHLATGEGPYLRTGDLGVVRDHEIFITGRLKDLIILRGRNVYPQDLERTVERCHAAMRLGGAAAFSTPGQEERVVVAAEVSRSYRVSTERSRAPGAQEDAAGLFVDAAELIRVIQSAVSEHHDVQVADVVLLRVGTLPRTPSGKVRRHACRESFVDGSFAAVALS
jgi:acyl-CoA synthetase (AMP-forming)/AMP-acid ligase II